MNLHAAQLLDHGDPAKEPKSFRGCLGQFPTGIAVVTARTLKGELAGITINSFSSVSLDPPLILWSINSNSRNLPIFTNASRFVINILAWNQVDIARHFASSGRDRSADADFFQVEANSPLLVGAVAHLECTLETSYEGGDHSILIGRVIHYIRYSGKPLLFVQGQYGVPEAHPDLITENTSQSGATLPASKEGDLLAEIFEARNRLSQRFEKYHLIEGISLAENRVLRRVQEAPGIDRADLPKTTFLGELQLDEAIGELVSRAWLKCDESCRYTLTDEGLRRRQVVEKRWMEFQADQTRGIKEADLNAARAVLEKLIERA